MIIFNDNWADEMDIDAMEIDYESNTNEEAKKKLLKDVKFPTSIAFGTNESNDYDNKEQLLECFSFQELTKEQLKVLEDLELTSYGSFPNLGPDYDIEDDEAPEPEKEKIILTDEGWKRLEKSSIPYGTILERFGTPPVWWTRNGIFIKETSSE